MNIIGKTIKSINHIPSKYWEGFELVFTDGTACIFNGNGCDDSEHWIDSVPSNILKDLINPSEVKQ